MKILVFVGKIENNLYLCSKILIEFYMLFLFFMAFCLCTKELSYFPLIDFIIERCTSIKLHTPVAAPYRQTDNQLQVEFNSQATRQLNK